MDDQFLQRNERTKEVSDTNLGLKLYYLDVFFENFKVPLLAKLANQTVNFRPKERLIFYRCKYIVDLVIPIKHRFFSEVYR